MAALHGARLSVVAAADVLPHERADQARLRRIAARLQADQVLRDPVIVGSVPGVDGYILLDGTNRREALVGLGLPWILVQVLDYADQHAVRLQTWCHAVAASAEALLKGSHEIPGLRPARLAPLEAAEALRDPSTLAVLLDHHQHLALKRRPGEGEGRAAQLRALIDLYEEGMTRVDCDPDDLEEGLSIGPHGPSTLVAFPPLSRSQVVALAIQGTQIPAGITRHTILTGRALRVNLSLDILDGSRTLQAANEALQEHLGTLQPRVYREPTILFDS